MRLLLTVWMVAALLATNSVAGEQISLREVMRRAREHSREVTAAQSRARAAEARATQARGFRLPSVSLQQMLVRTDSPAEAFAFTMNQKRFSFDDFVMGDPNNPDPLNTAITRLELALPIYTGGELKGRIQQAELAAAAEAVQRDWRGHAVALAAAEAFVMLDRALEYVGLLERARDTVEAHVNLARAYVEQGMLVRSELLRAEVELARVEDLLQEARGGVRVASANLAFRVGADQGSEWELEPLPVPAGLGEDLAGWLDSAATRKDLTAARQLLRAGELEERVKKAALLPTVGVVARGDLVDDRVFGSHGGSATIMAVASINLYAGGSDRAAMAVARWEADAGRQDVERFAEGVMLEVRQAFEEAVTMRARHATAQKALAAAREAERITSERFATGVVKMIDLLDASTARRETETRELVARAEAHSAALRLATKAGRAPESVLP